MSITTISEKNKFMLWGKAAARCQYQGCNQKLYLDPLTKSEFNQAYIAHIVADKPDGPRGDAVLSPKLQNELSNLMLLCDRHHRLVDKVDIIGHPSSRLQAMKKAHEDRILLAADILPNRQTQIILYGANIGSHTAIVNESDAKNALFPDWYPSSEHSIELSLKNSSKRDQDSLYYEIESDNLEALFRDRVRERIQSGVIPHLSVFGIAPQPLLIKFGVLLGEILPIRVFQPHREPKTWAWLSVATNVEYKVIPPEKLFPEGKVALVFSLSGTIIDERIIKVLGPDCNIWKVTISNPNNDFLKDENELGDFRKLVRRLFDEIKAVQTKSTQIHVFPAMPPACAIEVGRVWMPKADLPMVIYDEVQSLGGFIKAIEIKNV